MTDTIQKFTFEHAPIRGAIIKLDQSIQSIMMQHHYPKQIQTFLGDILMATALMYARIKFDGKIIVQIQNSGALKLLVAKCNQHFDLSGVVQYDRSADLNELQQSLEQGQLVVTLIKSDHAQPYQSIIPFNGHSVQEALEDYFSQSEQLPTRFIFSHHGNQCTGLLLQLLPTDNESASIDFYIEASKLSSIDHVNDLNTLDNEALLKKLLPHHDLRLYDATPVQFRCECSVARMQNAILTLGKQEAHAILNQDPYIEVTCEFCANQYRFTRDDIDTLFKEH